MKSTLIAITLGLFLMACSASITEVKNGMSTAEVEKMMGKANSTNSSSSSSSMNDSVVTATSRAEWTYTGKGSIVFENDKVVEVKASK